MKIAVITGASSGIGIDFAKEILKQRPEIEKIWVIARRKEKLEQLKEELGDKIYPLALDITSDK
ncbi:MAG: SDR family NAD(P)-dependent oxidoreductase, partial [Clostridia bacterium]|nr:SDR family NAD(P)-dependent oxidoreductase [Clostridia bacterium]